jgi:hypothetical protein
MDSQDNKVLAARIRSSVNAPAFMTPERQVYLRGRLLERASQQTILPPSPFARLKHILSGVVYWLQDLIHGIEVALIVDDDRYHRVYQERAIHLSHHQRKQHMGWMSGDYLEPLRYNMMKINVC